MLIEEDVEREEWWSWVSLRSLRLLSDRLGVRLGRWESEMVFCGFRAALAERGVLVASPPPSASMRPFVSLVLLASLGLAMISIVYLTCAGGG